MSQHNAITITPAQQITTEVLAHPGSASQLADLAAYFRHNGRDLAHPMQSFRKMLVAAVALAALVAPVALARTTTPPPARTSRSSRSSTPAYAHSRPITPQLLRQAPRRSTRASGAVQLTGDPCGDADVVVAVGR
jgi:hypothetical protein